ncbi:MAG: membrane protein insertase YidC [Thermodesulfovibrionales bacterium]|nr:membrane protein insertase YidC [Thermodesulfovibrionales bacterium]
MDRNLLLAIVLSIAILIGYQYLYTMFYPQETQQAKPQKDEAAQQKTKSPEKRPESKDVEPQQVKEKKDIIITPTSEQGRIITIDNDVMKVNMSTKGATIVSVELKRYKDSTGNNIVLKSDNILPPFAIGGDENFNLSQANFVSKAKEHIKVVAGSKADVVFEFAKEGISIRRIFRFTHENYAIELTDEVNGLNSYWITLGKEFGIYEKTSDVHYGPVVLKDAERLEYDIGKVKEPKYFKEGLKWIAQEDKYFFSAIVPKSKFEEAKVWDRSETTLSALKMPSGSNSYLIYAGPKEYDALEKVGYGLEHIVDFGFFSFLARPLFWVLKFFYSFTYNYGVAIILLTILVRIPFIPVINAGQKSMKKIQDMQPRMAEIKEKYKNDPQKMQKELMELYKTHKINPMSGCLPILLQIPVFFALYKVLLIAIELRSAPFVWWITDLSAKDPYYILPIIMGATMVIQQKMTPSAMDPMQQKIMMLMPVVFTFLFLTFPSGLVLYWLVNNILSIAQQYYINQKIKKESAT